MVRFKGKRIATSWNTLRKEKLGLIDSEQTLLANALRVNDLSGLRPYQEHILCRLSEFMIDTEPLFQPAHIDEGKFRDGSCFRQWVDTMLVMRDNVKDDKANHFAILSEVIKIYDLKGTTTQACQQATTIFNYCVGIAKDLNVREFPQDANLQKAMQGKFDHFHETNYLFALSGGNFADVEKVGSLSISNALISLYYQHANAIFQDQYSKLLQSSKGGK